MSIVTETRPVDNIGNLFTETSLKLWEACGDLEGWQSGYTDRLAKNLFSISCQKPEPADYSELQFQTVFQNYLRRRVLLEQAGKLPSRGV